LKRKGKIRLLGLLLLLTVGLLTFTSTQNSNEDQILASKVDPKIQDLQLYWKNDKGELLKSIQQLKTHCILMGLSQGLICLKKTGHRPMEILE
jgi:uncharacterized protein YigE (DUF2233 family)